MALYSLFKMLLKLLVEISAPLTHAAQRPPQILLKLIVIFLENPFMHHKTLRYENICNLDIQCLM